MSLTWRERALFSAGYRQIASDAHAYQLLRRELKWQARVQRRQGEGYCWCMDYFKKFKPGNWYKFYRTKDGRRLHTLIEVAPQRPKVNT